MDSGSYLVEKYNGFYEKYGDGQANCEDDLIALLNAADQFFYSPDQSNEEALFAAWNIYNSGVRYSLAEVPNSAADFESMPEKKDNRFRFINALTAYEELREKTVNIMIKLGGASRLLDSNLLACQN